MRYFYNIATAVLYLFVTGCQYDPFAGDLTTQKPAVNDVCGTYKFERQTVCKGEVLPVGRQATIILNRDGAFQMTNVPDLTDTRDCGGNKLITASGHWTMEIVGGVDNGWGHPKSAWGVMLTGLTRNVSIGFMGDEAPYKLIFTYGDPDEGAVMIFSQK